MCHRNGGKWSITPRTKLELVAKSGWFLEIFSTKHQASESVKMTMWPALFGACGCWGPPWPEIGHHGANPCFPVEGHWNATNAWQWPTPSVRHISLRHTLFRCFLKIGANPPENMSLSSTNDVNTLKKSNQSHSSFSSNCSHHWCLTVTSCDIHGSPKFLSSLESYQQHHPGVSFRVGWSPANCSKLVGQAALGPQGGDKFWRIEKSTVAVNVQI